MAPKTEPKVYVGIGLDFETGGLDPQTCACTQIAVQAVRLDTWQVTDQYQAYILPYNKQSSGLPTKKILRTRSEIAREDNTLMLYETLIFQEVILLSFHIIQSLLPSSF